MTINPFGGAANKPLTFTGGASVTYDGSAAKSVAIPGNLTALSDGVWKAGNTLTLGGWIPLSGIISSGTTKIYLLLPLGKPVASGVAASVTALKGGLRGTQGYIDGSSGSSDIDFKSGSTYTVSTVLEHAVGLLSIIIKKSSVFTNVANNTPVSLLTTVLTVSFAASGDEPLPGPEIFGDDAGTPEDPIPYGGNMVLEAGKYYSQAGVTYRCTRDTGIPVYHDLADSVGLYVEKA